MSATIRLLDDPLTNDELLVALTTRIWIAAPPMCPKACEVAEGKRLIWLGLYEYTCPVCKTLWWGGESDEDCTLLFARGIYDPKVT